LIKDLAANTFTEIKAADLLPKGTKKGVYSTEGLTQKDPHFKNGQRILDLAAQVQHQSEYTEILIEAISQG